MLDARQTVVFASDHHYWAHTFVAMHSLAVNNPNLALEVWILSSEAEGSFDTKLEWIRTTHPHVEVYWRQVDERLLEHAPIFLDNFTVATYYRLLLGSLLPDSVKRVLYLDSDVIVRRSLHDLFAIDLDGLVLAAVPERQDAELNPNHGSFQRGIDLPPGTPYLNAGVLLLDLEQWRNDRYEEQCLEFINRHANDADHLLFQDQDTLNAVCSGKWRQLSSEFNYTLWTTTTHRHEFERLPDRRESRDAPAIAHLAETPKPWNWYCPHPYGGEYWAYRMQTPFADHLQFYRYKVLTGIVHIRRTGAALVGRLPYGGSIVRAVKMIAGT